MRNYIKEMRQKLNITQAELADAVDVRRETILYLEQGKYNPSLLLAFNIAKKLQTTIQDLFIFEEDVP